VVGSLARCETSHTTDTDPTDQLTPSKGDVPLSSHRLLLPRLRYLILSAGLPTHRIKKQRQNKSSP